MVLAPSLELYEQKAYELFRRDDTCIISVFFDPMRQLVRHSIKSRE